MHWKFREEACAAGVFWLFALGSLAFCARATAEEDLARRQALREFAVKSFRASSNHCGTFADVAAFAADHAKDAATWFEDMRLVIVGEDWRRRAGKRGALFMGSITNDSGFKTELRDGSPQVEHAFGAIFLGKAAPPGASTMVGSFVELATGGPPDSKVAAADHLLYAYGADIGARISNSNLKDAPRAIRRTLCE